MMYSFQTLTLHFYAVMGFVIKTIYVTLLQCATVFLTVQLLDQ